MWRLALMAGVVVGIAGCGQRGPLYMPDKNARVVTHPAAASAPQAGSSAPADSSAATSAPR